jgi:hypothetical protein
VKPAQQPAEQAKADAAQFRRMSGPEFAALPPEEKRRLSDADAVVEAFEKAEQQRRANAYPKLVEALNRIGLIAENGTTSRAGATRVIAREVRALLREHGEAS